MILTIDGRRGFVDVRILSLFAVNVFFFYASADAIIFLAKFAFRC